MNKPNQVFIYKPCKEVIKLANGQFLAVYDAEELDELDQNGIRIDQPSQEELKKIYIEQEKKKHMAKKTFNIELDHQPSLVEEIINPQTATPEEPGEQPKASIKTKAYTLNLEADQMDFLRVFAMVEKKAIKGVIQEALEEFYKMHPEDTQKAKDFLN